MLNNDLEKDATTALTLLSVTSSTNDKIKILKEHTENELLKLIMMYTYNPFYKYFMKSTMPIASAVKEKRVNLSELIDKINDAILVNGMRGNKAIDLVEDILSQSTKTQQRILIRMMKKDQRIGVGIGLLNKAWKGFIPELKRMRASSMTPSHLTKIVYPATEELKYDGSCLITTITGDGASCISQNLSEVNLPMLKRLFNSAIDKLDEPVAIEGELVYTKSGKMAPRKTTNGYYNKAIQGELDPEIEKHMIYYIWDVIPLKDYFNGEYDVTYKDRRDQLTAFADAVDPSHRLVKPSEFRIVNNEEEAIKLFHYYHDDLGYEGGILKNLGSIWKAGRSSNLVKLKNVKEADVRIVNINEGTGKYEGMLGSVDVEIENAEIECSVGSGFTDDQRTKLWEMKDSLNGSIIEIRYNGIVDSKSKPGKKSFYLPIFSRLRPDKTSPNTITDF